MFELLNINNNIATIFVKIIIFKLKQFLIKNNYLLQLIFSYKRLLNNNIKEEEEEEDEKIESKFAIPDHHGFVN